MFVYIQTESFWHYPALGEQCGQSHNCSRASVIVNRKFCGQPDLLPGKFR